MEVAEIERGWGVYTEDGKRAGDVVEVHPHYLLISRGLLFVRDVYVPRYAVATVEENKVFLAITDERLRKMGWTSPPPEPPPAADGSTPHLVPTYDTEEPGPPPLSYGENTWQTEESASSEVDSGAYYSGFPQVDDEYADIGTQVGSTIETQTDVYIATQQLGWGPPIILIHGWGFDRRIWDYLLLDLPETNSVVTFDMRGYGASSAPWYGYDVWQLSRDLRVVLRTLNLTNAVLVGVDIGAAVALRYVLDGGSRAESLVLIAPAVRVADEPELAPYTVVSDEPAASSEAGDVTAASSEESELAQRCRDGLRRDRPRLASELVELWAPSASDETKAWLRDGMLGAGPHALLHGLQVLTDTTVSPADGIDALRLPTLVLHGDRDSIVPQERGRALAEAIPGARFVALDGAGHLPMLDDPARLISELRSFIDGVAAEQAAAFEAMSDGDGDPYPAGGLVEEAAVAEAMGTAEASAAAQDESASADGKTVRSQETGSPAALEAGDIPEDELPTLPAE